MESVEHTKGTYRPTDGDDCLKIFLSNLDGRIDTQDLQKFFSPYGKIEHIESWTRKSAIILFSDIESVDRVLSKHRKCTINKQEIYVRRYRYGFIERAYMDSQVLFIKPTICNSSMKWNEKTIGECFHDYEKNIEKIRISSKSFHALISFDDYDIVDRILVQANLFNINGISIEMKRAKSKEMFHEDNEQYINKLIKRNKLLRKEIERQKTDSRHEVKILKEKINKLKIELFDLQARYYYCAMNGYKY